MSDSKITKSLINAARLAMNGREEEAREILSRVNKYQERRSFLLDILQMTKEANLKIQKPSRSRENMCTLICIEYEEKNEMCKKWIDTIYEAISFFKKGVVVECPNKVDIILGKNDCLCHVNIKKTLIYNNFPEDLIEFSNIDDVYTVRLVPFSMGGMEL